MQMLNWFCNSNLFQNQVNHLNNLQAQKAYTNKNE